MRLNGQVNNNDCLDRLRLNGLIKFDILKQIDNHIGSKAWKAISKI